jgi:hypothetical protein
MAKISELKEIIVDLRVELHMAQLPYGTCPYRWFGNPTNKELDCNEIDCNVCKRNYFDDYEAKVRKEVKSL